MVVTKEAFFSSSTVFSSCETWRKKCCRVSVSRVKMGRESTGSFNGGLVRPVGVGSYLDQKFRDGWTGSLFPMYLGWFRNHGGWPVRCPAS